MRYRSVDMAGNIEATQTAVILIDKTAPNIAINSPEAEKEYLLGQSIVSAWSALDDISGVASATATVPNGQAIDASIVGPKTFVVAVADNAGNEASKTVSYYVRYDFSEVLQPVNANGTSVFKLGSTVPVKFALRDADGNYIPGATAKIYLAKVSDEVVGDEVEAVSTSAASEGNLFRYDADTNQYVFNLSTQELSIGTWRIKILLDDGSSKYVMIGLR